MKLGALTLATAALLGCKGRDARTEAPPATGSAGSATGSAGSGSVAVPVDAWTACQAALAAAPKLPANRRARSIIEGCQPCGDWAPILGWATPPEQGGPDRRVIEQRLAACQAWCEPAAKIQFMGALDDARAQGQRTPWRLLGEVCKDKVSAGADSRFMSASLFALDRIARAAAVHEGGPALLAAIEIPLPAVSTTGVGFGLPTSPLARPAEPPGQVSLSQTEIRIGPLPRARLGATGVTVTGADYPGELVEIRGLAAALTKLAPASAGPIAVFAPHGLPAARLAALVAARGTATLHLAVVATGPVGWSMYGTVPIALGHVPAPAGVRLVIDGTGDGAVTAAKAASRDALKAAPVTLELLPAATVASVAKVVGALAFFEVSSVSLTAKR